MQYCYKENIRRSSCISHVVVFCKPILAMFLQRKHQTLIMHLACCCCVLSTHHCNVVTKKTDDHHASRMLRLYFVNPTSEGHHASRVLLLCFVSPSLQCFYKENTFLAESGVVEGGTRIQCCFLLAFALLGWPNCMLPKRQAFGSVFSMYFSRM